jgi:D-lactate dehydrogenase (cytochrome)
VVFPETTEQVSQIMRVLQRERAPFVPRGAGTGLSGGAVALQEAVIIEFARMRRLLLLDVENRRAVVQTGLVNARLSQLVAPHGLYYAPDPSSQPTCTIGGNIAENSGGIHCLKYGVTVDHVIAAKVVLSDGEIVELSAEKGGYDLLGVFIGSEGTFGLATEATVKLLPVPPAARTLLADFLDVDDASRAVSAIIAAGVIPAGLEMIDGATIRAVEQSVFAAGMPQDAAGALLIELDGLEAGLDEETGRVIAICRQNGARTVRRAQNEAERKKLWAARKSAFGAMGRMSPDLMLQDAVVPRSRLPEVLAETYKIGARFGLRVANVFHAGDGNLHPLIPFDSRDLDETERVKFAGQAIMEKCVEVGGTITGEHGVGFDKSDYMPLIFSDDDLNAMLRVRAAFDPTGLCNPGKIIPVLRGCGEARVVGKELNTETQRHRDTESFKPNSAGKLQAAVQTPQFAHSPADLVATAPAEMTLREFNERLREHGQWLPLDPPGAGPLGKIVAQAAAGPLALGYGGPRNLVLGMRVTLPDGTQIKTGGRVVKNVAGYDLGKLFTGSRGKLGRINEITFRLRPLPASDETVVASGPLEDLWPAGRKIWLDNLQPVALELLAPDLAELLGLPPECALLARFAGACEQTAWQIKEARARLVNCQPAPAAIWRDLAANTDAPHLVWQARTLPSETLNLLKTADFPAARWQIGCGDGRLRAAWPDAPCDTETRAALDAIRANARKHGGSLTVLQAAEDWRKNYDWNGLDEGVARLEARLTPGAQASSPAT